MKPDDVCGMASSAVGGSARGVEVDVARVATVEPRAPRRPRAVAARERRAAALGDYQREVMRRVPRAAHGRRQPRAARVHVEAARRAAVEEAARGAAAGADVAREGPIAAGLGELELVWVVSRREERPRVAGAGVVDGEVAAPAAAVGGAGQVLPAHVAAERPNVVPLHQLVPWMGEVSDGVLRHDPEISFAPDLCSRHWDCMGNLKLSRM